MKRFKSASDKGDAIVTFKHLLYFCTVVEQGQISKAAKILHISQPPLSQRIKELEESLNVELIRRQGREWQVTEAGRLVYQKAQRILSHVDALRTELQGGLPGVSGLVRVGACPPLAPMLVQVIPRLAERYPNLHLRVLVADNASIESEIQQRSLDMGLVILPVGESNYSMFRYAAQDYVAVFGRNVPAPAKECLDVGDLAGLPLLLSRRHGGGGRHEMLIRAFQQEGITPKVAMDTQDTRLILDLLYQGMEAVGMLHELEVDNVKCAHLVKRRLNVEGVRFTPALVHLQDAYLTSAAERVLQALRETVPSTLC